MIEAGVTRRELYMLLPRETIVRSPIGNITVHCDPIEDDEGLGDNDRGEPIAQWDIWADLSYYRAILKNTDTHDDSGSFLIGSIANFSWRSGDARQRSGKLPWGAGGLEPDFYALGGVAEFLGREDEVDALGDRDFVSPTEALAAMAALFESLLAALPLLRGAAHFIESWPASCGKSAAEVELITYDEEGGSGEAMLLCVHK